MNYVCMDGCLKVLQLEHIIMTSFWEVMTVKLLSLHSLYYIVDPLAHKNGATYPT